MEQFDPTGSRRADDERARREAAAATSNEQPTASFGASAQPAPPTAQYPAQPGDAPGVQGPTLGQAPGAGAAQGAYPPAPGYYYGTQAREQGQSAQAPQGTPAPGSDASASGAQPGTAPEFVGAGFGAAHLSATAGGGVGGAGNGPGGPGNGGGDGSGFHQSPWHQQQPEEPKKSRKGLFAGLAAGALALAVVAGAVPGWALGHQAGVNSASGQASSQNANSDQTQRSWDQLRNGQGGSSDGSNDGGYGSDGGAQDGSNPFGQDGTTNPFGGNGGGGSNGQGNGSQSSPYLQMPFSQGGGSSRGQGSTPIVQGEKMSSGVDGMVLIDTKLPGGQGAGTGMILNADGTVLTNYHVVQGSTTVSVIDTASGKTYTADVVGHDQAKDVAVLKLRNASGLKTVTTNTDGVTTGDAVSSVGNASGEGYLRKLDGKVTATQQSITTASEGASQGEKLNNLIETDADVVPGYSGGAMMNSKGEVVGMTTAASSGRVSETVQGYAIPIADALDIAKKIESGQSGDGVELGRGAALGIEVLSSDSGMAQQGGFGVAVGGVTKGGAAEQGGIKQGDTIIGLDGKATRDFATLKSIVDSHKSGDKVEVTWVTAAGKQESKTLTLGESTVN